MNGTVVAVGTFDGVHLGHREILRTAAEVGVARGLLRIAYTFPVPPRVVEGRAEADLLLPFAARRTLLLRYVDRVDAVPFEEIRDLSPGDFARRVLRDRLQARAIVVGEGFRFGCERTGDPSLLKDLAEEWKADVVLVARLLVRGEMVSSTRIRSLLRAGDVEGATALLGRPPILVGDVVVGDGIGRTLGFPTANLALDPLVLRPADGVYFCHAFWERRDAPGLLYLGTRPTLEGASARCEVHLLREPGEDLVGKPFEVQLLSRIRGDERFPSVGLLTEQMRRDAERARSLEAGLPSPPLRILG